MTRSDAPVDPLVLEFQLAPAGRYWIDRELAVAGLTTHPGLAAQVSEDVERLLAAREEMKRMLEFPHQAPATPI